MTRKTVWKLSNHYDRDRHIYVKQELGLTIFNFANYTFLLASADLALVTRLS
jgi:hypothetical protein